MADSYSLPSEAQNDRLPTSGEQADSSPTSGEQVGSPPPISGELAGTAKSWQAKVTALEERISSMEEQITKLITDLACVTTQLKFTHKMLVQHHHNYSHSSNGGISWKTSYTSDPRVTSQGHHACIGSYQ